MFLTTFESNVCRCKVKNALDLQKRRQGAVFQESNMLRTMFKSKI